MTPDLYAAWLTAGDRLQSAVAWAAANWNGLAAFAAAATVLAAIAAWCIWGALRNANRTVNAALAEINDDRKEEL
jgi:uncharacterized membrane protein YqjE